MMAHVGCVLLILCLPAVVSVNFETDDDAHGLRIFISDQYILGAFNIYSYYMIDYLARPSGTDDGNICYNFIASERQKYYIYSLAGLSTLDNETIRFVQVAEDVTTLDVLLSVAQTTCDETVYTDTIICHDCHQQYMQIRIDPQEKYAYLMADSFLLSYDLTSERIVQNFTFGDIVLRDFRQRVAFRSFVVYETWAFVTGYLISAWSDSFGFYTYYLFQLQPELSVRGGDRFFEERAYNVPMVQYSRISNLPISIDRSTGLTAVSIPSINRVVVCRVITASENSWSVSINRNILLTDSDSIGISSFGRSVAWLQSGRLAVFVGQHDQGIWSQSQLRIYSNVSLDSSRAHLDFVLPNHQQDFSSFAKNTAPSEIFLVLARNNSLLFVNSDSSLCYVPPSPPGSCSIIMGKTGNIPFYRFEQSPCIRGTFRNETSLGPCTVCPPGTMNSGNDSTRCRACQADAFCPPGASGEVDLDAVSSYTQLATYPDSPDINNIDDHLLISFLSIDVRNKPGHCLLRSPLFWIITISTVCFIIWLLMFLFKRCTHRESAGSKRRQQLKNLFKHTDIIGEGERWIGGLASIIILVLIGVIFWISIDYLNAYPIETISFDESHCQGDAHNTQFDNALQLPLAGADGERWPIFQLLDEQEFTMSVDLINIGQPPCESISVQWTRANVRSVNLPINNCTLAMTNTIRSFRFDVPTHQSTIKIDILGAYFLGAVRLCLHGDARTQDRVHRLHQLDTCTLFYTANQTIGLVTDFTVKLVKVVNQTKPLDVGGEPLFDGRWGTTMSTDALSDDLIFQQNGQYLRYISDRTTFTISLSEESYFLQNNQKPIVRITELVFHVLLFIFTIIDLFTTAFLIYKLCCSPLSHAGRLLFSSFRQSLRKRNYETSVSQDETSDTATVDKIQF